MFMTRRDVLTTGVMGGVLGGDGGAAAAQRSDEDAQVVQALRSIVSELQQARRSAQAGEVAWVGQVREQMLQFLRSTNKWPDFVEVGSGVWFTLYDWHVRFGREPVVVKLPSGYFGLTFMFTTLVLRQDQGRDYIGMAYDREK